MADMHYDGRMDMALTYHKATEKKLAKYFSHKYEWRG